MTPETRSKVREKTMFAIYDTLFYENDGLEFDPKEILGGVFGLDYDDVDIFAREIYIKAIINKDEIVATIEPNLNKWEFKRLNIIAQAIMLLATSECNYAKLSDKSVVINESVKMAKKYLDSKDYKYINAVLDKVLVDLGNA